MFENLQMAPPDPILGLTDAFKKDPNPQKINLGVGVFQDEDGKTATLECVKRAEAKLLAQAAPKTYLPIEGSPEYGKHVRALLFGAGDALVENGLAVTAQAPGGTGALRVAADLARSKLGAKKIWVSDTTWAYHQAIFQAAGLEPVNYAYYDKAKQGLAFEAMLADLQKAERGDLVLLHTCCHNPSGIDPTLAQWDALAEVVKARGLFPLFDFAYQGFGDGIDQDAAPVRTFVKAGLELMVCSSFSKNFGLYNERVGALTLLAGSKDVADKALSQLKVTVRTNYSNPPQHGGAIVNTVLGDEELAALWRKEVDGMRTRILEMRTLFVQTLKEKGVKQDFSFIAGQKGMFSFAGITPEQVDRLKEKHAIYAVRSGRINVAGMRKATMDRLCSAIAEVLSA
jgi:aspartate/tyrosine/aromatic aminotransferase